MVVWKKPFECVVVKENEIIRQVLTSDLLKKHLGRYYLDTSLLNANDISPKLLHSLGVRSLDLNDVLEILKTVFSSTDDLKNPKTTAKWLLVLYFCLNNYSMQQEEKLIKQLTELEFIPILRHGKKEMVSLEKCNVFFPLSLDKAKKPVSKLLGLIEKDLNLLDVESLLCLDQLKNDQIVALLKNLGVKRIEPKEVIEFHIIDAFKANQCSTDTLILYLIYVHDSSNVLSQTNLDVLKANASVMTNKGFVKLSEDIFLTPIYGNKYDLKQMFSRFDWCLVNSVYFERSLEFKEAAHASEKETAKKGKQQQQQQQMSSLMKNDKNQHMLSWRKFFISLGN